MAAVLAIVIAQMTTALAAPPDDFSTTISGATGSVTGTTTAATGQASEYVAPYSAGNNALNSHWYSWTAPANGTVTFQTCSATQTNYDTTLAAFNKATLPLTTDTAAAQNDDTANCATTTSSNANARGSRVTFAVTMGTSYAIQVDGYQALTGNYLLSWTFTGPSFSITKAASPTSISAPGTITYTIAIANTGNTTLTGTTISDSLTLNGSGLTLTSGPTRTSGDTNSNNQMETTETWIYTATYSATQANIDTGGSFSNTATFDTTQTIASTSNAATTTITQSPSFTNVKSQISGPNPVTAAGQTIGYRITIANTGNVTLTTPTISDTLLLGAASRTLTSGPTYASGDTDSDGSIDVGETWLYAASYIATQTDLDGTGSFSNQATFDTAQTAPLASNDLATTVTRTPALSLNKTWTFAPGGDLNNNGTADKNDIIRYTFETTNSGNVTVSTVDVIETAFSGAGGPVNPANETISNDVAPANDSTDTVANDGIWAVLKPGDTVRYRGDYTVVQADIDNQ